jgi:hypothetical protein
MKVKFELEDMEGVENLTPSKKYQYKGDKYGGVIFDDVGHELIIALNSNSAHLNHRTCWELIEL